MTRDLKIMLFDWIFSRDTKPCEFFLSLLTLGIGARLMSGAEDVYDLVQDGAFVEYYWVFYINALLPKVGLLLVVAAFGQIFGLLLSVCRFVTIARIIRWLSSLIDGCVWFSLVVFLTGRLPMTDGLHVIYAALFLGDVWIVMGIAYRGYRGRNAD